MPRNERGSQNVPRHDGLDTFEDGRRKRRLRHVLLNRLELGQEFPRGQQLVLPELTVPLTEAMAGLGSSTIIFQALLLFSKPGDHDLFRQLEM